MSQEQLVDIYNRGYHAIKGWWNQQADAACSQQMINDEMKPGGLICGVRSGSHNAYLHCTVIVHRVNQGIGLIFTKYVSHTDIFYNIHVNDVNG